PSLAHEETELTEPDILILEKHRTFLLCCDNRHDFHCIFAHRRVNSPSDPPPTLRPLMLPARHHNTFSKDHTMRIALVPLFLLACALTSNAGDDFKPEPGYVSLFNGKDLAGWKYYKETDLTGKTETADKRFRVADGIIIAEEGKGIKDLYTVKAYNTEFNLKMESRASLKAASGVYVRGPQLQVRDFIRRKEMLKQLTKFKNDDWNELDITVKNGVVSTVVNGKTLTDKDTLTLSVENG